LKQDGGDVEGWLRLVRAKAALVDARQAVANDTERLRQLNEGVKTLGLDG
jgi:cytochrome c-type biogenesis protein CcmH